jgi:chromosome segregation ATPase
MPASHETLKEQIERHEQQLRELNAFIKELHTMTDKHGTPTEQFAEDLAEAENNIEYYESEIARIRKLLPKPHSRLPQNKEQLAGTFVISSISFIAGVLLGASMRGKRKHR